MVKIFFNIVKAFKSYVLYLRCKRAIKRADRNAVVTGKKWLVLMYGGKPIVVSKQHLKSKIKGGGAFCKRFTPEKAEALAIYKTQ